VADYNEYTLPGWTKKVRPASKAIFMMELDRRGVTYELNGPRVEFVSRRGKRAWFAYSTTSLNKRSANQICQNKMRTKEYLRNAGTHTPPGMTFSRQDQQKALHFAQTLGYPVVVKPVDGVAGRHVFSDINSEDSFAAAWGQQPEEQTILVEKHVEGDDYRAYALDGRIVAIARRDPPSVLADGHSTIAELIAALNKQRRASGNPIHTQVKIEGVVSDYLKRQGLSSDRVCEEGMRLLLRPNANISTGGAVCDVTDDAPEPVVEAASKAATAVPGLRVVGLDILYTEGKPAHVLEMNHNPMLSIHHFPWVGQPRDVARDLVEAMLAH